MSTLEDKLNLRHNTVTPQQFAEMPLADALEIALADLEALEKIPDKYQINMMVFRGIDPVSRKCMVCLAGAAMERTLKVEKFADPKIVDRLTEISDIAVYEAPVAYHQCPEAFKDYIRERIAVLRA